MSGDDAGVRNNMLVSTAWLAAHLADPTVRIVDMRGQVATTEATPGVQEATYRGRPDAYAEGHIAGAIYLDWTRDLVDLADPVPAQAARPEQLASLLGARGIGNEHTVVAYDDGPAMQFATRLWWLLRLNGHERALVLDGGLPKWRREGRPLTTEVPAWSPATFTSRPRPALRVEAAEMLGLIGAPGVRLLDARDARQYSGALRRGKRGGHIPGAVSIPREALLDPQEGTFRDDAALAAALGATGVRDDERVVAYCNGGVAATSVLFALALEGHSLESLANYDGSWNEWGNRDDTPIVTGERP